MKGERMFYEYECPRCGHRETLNRKVDDRNNPVGCIWCLRVDGNGARIQEMQRVVSRFTFNANLEKDKPENNLYRILAGSSKTDQVARMREDDKKYEKTLEGYKIEEPKYTSVGDILSTGIRPDMSAEAVRQWREEHVPKDDFAEASGVDV